MAYKLSGGDVVSKLSSLSGVFFVVVFIAGALFMSGKKKKRK